MLKIYSDEFLCFHVLKIINVIIIEQASCADVNLYTGVMQELLIAPSLTHFESYTLAYAMHDIAEPNAGAIIMLP